MAPKVYLSPAAHEYDRPCSAVSGCSENTHANAYLDELTPYLDACGIAWRRNPASRTGSAGVQAAVRESNAWGATLHYVVHTNGANGTAKGSRPLVYPRGAGKAWAETILKWRGKIYPYPMRVIESDELYEIVNTAAVCVYEELVFHDNAEDAGWLHANMRTLAEYTARAFCEIFGLAFVDPYVKKGDVDGDGRVTTTDARQILQAAAGTRELTEQQKVAADVNGDGTVNTADARATLQIAAKN